MHLSKFYTLILLLRIGLGWWMGGVGWLEKWGIKLSHLSTEVEVEVEDELGKKENCITITVRELYDIKNGQINKLTVLKQFSEIFFSRKSHI